LSELSYFAQSCFPSKAFLFQAQVDNLKVAGCCLPFTSISGAWLQLGYNLPAPVILLNDPSPWETRDFFIYLICAILLIMLIGQENKR
jgi:hypothetical protein